MVDHRVVSREEWLEARKALLEKEKRLTREHDELSRQRRDLPWVRVDKPYVFHGPQGEESLAQLFEGRSQLIVYHFMFGPDWEAGCKSCSFWADNFNGIVIHLQHRDVNLIAVSRAPFPKIEAYRRRMGWQFKWVSAYDNDFNFDYRVTFSEAQMRSGAPYYNFRTADFPESEAPGISVFFKDERGAIFHTYSCYGRGLDMMNGAYQYLDLVPKGRDEAGLPYTMAWLRRRDEYAQG